jgi:hypothetical protein
MNHSASQASAFYREVAETRKIWTIRDEGGFPAPMNSEGKRSQPFWSSRSRVEKIIQTVPAYAGFRPHELSWVEFQSRWVPDLKRDEILVGVNWSGPGALGYDIEPDAVQRNVEHHIPSASPSA